MALPRRRTVEPAQPVLPQVVEEPPAQMLAAWAKRASDALIEYTEQLTTQVHHLQALLDASQATVAAHASTIKNLSHRLAEAETQLVIDERQFESLTTVVRELHERVAALEAGSPATAPEAETWARGVKPKPAIESTTPEDARTAEAPVRVPPPPPPANAAVIPPNGVPTVVDLRTVASTLPPPTVVHPRRKP